MLNYLQPADVLTIPAPVAVTAGDGVVFGSGFGVAACDAAIGEEVAVHVVGAFVFDKVVGQAMTLGQPVYFDANTQAVTTTATGTVLIGVAIEAAASGDIQAKIRLHGSWGA